MTEGSHKLGEVLRAAREAKAVDLNRVERDTKIRVHYLSALERGEYRELPGAVYTKGFLRNYGLYLGLDPEYLIDLYRLETAALMAERIRPPAPPRPIARRRARAFVVTPGAIVATILTILVAVFVIWLGWEFVNFARTPELRVLQPPGDVTGYTQMTYTVSGVSEPSARITVDGLRENPSVMAGEDGRFSVEVELVPGSNVITLTAFDPVTRRDSEAVSRTITVTGAEATASPIIAFTLDQPATEATLASPVTLSGRDAPATTITVEAVLVEAAPPNFAVRDAADEPVTIQPVAPTAPATQQLTAGADGAYTGQIALAPGTWELRVTSDLAGEPIARRIIVSPPQGIAGTVAIGGGASYLELEEDDVPVDGIWGTVRRDGETIPVDATRELRVRAGNASVVRLVVNGIDLGPMGGPGIVVEWRITPLAP